MLEEATIVPAIALAMAIDQAIARVMGIAPQTMVDLRMEVADHPRMEAADHPMAAGRHMAADLTVVPGHPMAAITDRANR